MADSKSKGGRKERDKRRVGGREGREAGGVDRGNWSWRFEVGEKGSEERIECKVGRFYGFRGIDEKCASGETADIVIFGLAFNDNGIWTEGARIRFGGKRGGKVRARVDVDSGELNEFRVDFSLLDFTSFFDKLVEESILCWERNYFIFKFIMCAFALFVNDLFDPIDNVSEDYTTKETWFVHILELSGSFNWRNFFKEILRIRELAVW
jgi:hypothetical protein